MATADLFKKLIYGGSPEEIKNLEQLAFSSISLAQDRFVCYCSRCNENKYYFQKTIYLIKWQELYLHTKLRRSADRTHVGAKS